MNKSNELETQKIGKLLWTFSIPAVIGMLVNALYSVVDRIFIGRGVGSLALSGVAITFPITNIIMGIGMLTGAGSAALVSIKLGEKKSEDAEKIVGNAFLLNMLIPIVTSIIGLIFLDDILLLLGATPEIMTYAKQFAGILIAGSVLQNIGFGLNPIIRSEGNPHTAMKTMLIGAILNFIFNPLFIFVFKMGVIGSALATLISQAVCSIWVTAYFLRKSRIRLRLSNMRPDSRIIKGIISIGISPFFMQVAASAVTIVINFSLKRFGGPLAIGAYSLIASIATLIVMPIFGINQGAQPIIGYNYGARNFDRVKKVLFLNMGVNTVLSTIGWFVVFLFPDQIIHIFTNDSSLIGLASKGLALYLFTIWCVGPQTACINYFQSTGKAMYSMILSLLRQVVILIPLILILPHFFGLMGVWYAGPVADFTSFCIAMVFITFEIKKISRLQA